MVYIGRYCPNIARVANKYVSNSALQKLRDSKSTVATPGGQRSGNMSPSLTINT